MTIIDVKKTEFLRARDKMRSGVDLWGGSERWQFADQYRAYLRINDYCRVMVRVRARVRVRVSIRVRLGLGLRIVVYKVLEI